MKPTKNFAILLLGHGYADYYRKDTATQVFYTYTYNTAHTGNYDYNDKTGEFTASSVPGTGTYDISGSASTVYPQRSNDYYDATFTSVNITFNKENVNTNDLHLFLKATTSLAGFSVTWASDSNFVMQTAEGGRNLYEAVAETGSFANTNKYYQNAKQIIIKELKPLSRVGRSIKFKVRATMNNANLDEVKIHSIEVLPNGIVFMGDNNA